MPPPIQPSTSDAGSGTHLRHEHWLGDFAAHVQLHPERTALVSGGTSLTYAELDEQSGYLAGHLANLGIGPGHHVGAGFQRSIELITALMGIVKSGAAYVPIDPAYPESRISQMITSAGLKTVITKQASARLFPGTDVICMDDIAASGSYRGEYQAADPVYAIFTSGSTGQPKAASVHHAGFANLLEWYRSELLLETEDRTLVISSPSFDLTQKNLFAPLLTGGTLVLDDCQTYDIARILGLIRTHGITLINCTPSAFYPLVDAAGADFAALSSLRFAVLGGEPISIPRLRAWLEHPACRTEVVNSYGPTECTDICLFHRLHRGNLDDFPFVPLGREIQNVNVTIRDENLTPLPDGQTGELCIGGIGVGRGYLFDPERSATSFVNGVYRTGDLAKRLPCGAFEFRGRADHQVKVNGFRIELGEIEIALNDHESVREAVVTASDDKLTAHIQGDVEIAQIREHLSARLPAYMVPGEFLFVEGFPLTPNGKVDRKALVKTKSPIPAVETECSDVSMESKILALWSGILGQPVNDPSANFFDLGGNSIHLAVVHVRLMEMTGREFPITDLFARPSARAIAEHLAPRKEAQAPSGIRDRARLAKAGFASFQRPSKR